MRRSTMRQAIQTQTAHVGKTTRYWILVMIIATICAATSLASAAERPTGPLTKSISDYHDSGPDFYTVLGRLSQRFNLQFGAELTGGIGEKPVSVQIRKGTMSDVLRAIVSRTGYEWAVRDGVINIHPEHCACLSDLFIGHFEVTNASPDEVRRALLDLPEVAAWLARNGVTERSNAEAEVPEIWSQPPPVSIRVDNTHLADVLNDIVQKAAWHNWLLSRYGDRNQYLDIQIN